MKKTLLIVLTLFFNATLAQLGAVNNGEAAPDFTLKGADGQEYKLSEQRGKWVVLEWTNYDCPFVKKFYRQGHMQALQAEMGEKGLVWFSICSSAPGKQGHMDAENAPKRFGDQKAKATALLLDPDGAVGRSYKAKTTPHIFLIDPEGKLAYQGAIDSIRSAKTKDIDGADNFIKLAVEQALAGKAISQSETKPYGCSVKY